MLRIRFHGRGGHGIKTAGRILGTAAFRSGLQAQDSPVYGAERRGAPLAAFNRIDSEPIRERGIIREPDLILIADETLLEDPAAGVLAGGEQASGVFLNTPHPGSPFAERFHLSCPIHTLDLTALTLETLGKGSALSAPLGAAACALSGLVTVEDMSCAVEEELAELRLSPEVIAKNVALARHVFSLVPVVTRRDRPAPSRAEPLHAPRSVEPGEGAPVIYARANSPARHTGSWRLVRPVIDREVCTRCGVCLVRCPDGAIHLDDQCYPVVDLDNCKGCLICCEECPLHGIRQEKEVHAW